MSFPQYVYAPGLPGLLSFVATVVLPLLVALVTRESWNSTVKGLLLLVLAAGNVVVTTELTTGHFSADSLTQVGMNFAIAVAFYFGLLKNTNLRVALAGITLAGVVAAGPKVQDAPLPLAAKFGIEAPAPDDHTDGLPDDFTMPAESDFAAPPA
jgi:hypothetical protein